MVTPILHAIVSTPQNGVYVAVFRYLGIEGYPGRENRAFPHIEIPCESYEHACAVVDGFNRRGKKD